jgi:hypothetical protein
MNQLKGEATKALATENLHPFQDTILPGGKRHSPWTQDGWDVFLDCPENIRRAIKYVEENPVKEGCRPQAWSFLTSYG